MPRDVTREHVQPRFRKPLPIPTPKPMTAADALRELLREGDLLGFGPDGRGWLLINADQRLFAFLQAFEAEAEDLEPDDVIIGECGQRTPDDDCEDGDADMDVEDHIIAMNAAAPGRTLDPSYAEDDEPDARDHIPPDPPAVHLPPGV